MSNSTVVEWLNENGQRCYPLVETSPRFITINATLAIDLNALILDAALFYETLPSSVSLNSIVTSSGNLTINIAGQPAFIVTGYVSATYPIYIRNSNNSLLVLGDASAIPNNKTCIIQNAQFEASTIVEIFHNTKGVSHVIIDGHSFTGDVALVDGYQLSLIPNGKVLTIEAGRNEGHPLPCGSFKGITNDCNTIASFVNGASPNISGNNIQFTAGNHIKIYNDPDNNRIYVGYDFINQELLSPVTQESVSWTVNSRIPNV